MYEMDTQTHEAISQQMNWENSVEEKGEIYE